MCIRKADKKRRRMNNLVLFFLKINGIPMSHLYSNKSNSQEDKEEWARKHNGPKMKKERKISYGILTVIVKKFDARIRN